jgi:hypothetical protein
MVRWIKLVAVAFSLALAGCSATGYEAKSGGVFGYAETELEPGIWRVNFTGNASTTHETVQTYWLYRSANLAADNGFDGFEILSNINLVDLDRYSPIRVASAKPVYVPIITPVGQPSLPVVAGDIRLLKKPFNLVPGKVFDAYALKVQLDPIVTGTKCAKDNVCPHVHHYLIREQSTPVG